MEHAKSDDRGIDTFLAILISPIAPCFVFTLLWMVASVLFLGPNPGTMPSPSIVPIVLLFSVAFLLVAYTALLLVGVPLFQILYSFRIRGRWPFVTLGFLAGAMMPLLFNSLWALQQHVVPFCAGIGASTAWIAWSIRRPDLDPA